MPARRRTVRSLKAQSFSTSGVVDLSDLVISEEHLDHLMPSSVRLVACVEGKPRRQYGQSTGAAV